MFELWINDGQYIKGQKLGRASKKIETLKARAKKALGKVIFINELDREFSQCIWIELPDGTPIGLIQAA